MFLILNVQSLPPGQQINWGKGVEATSVFFHVQHHEGIIFATAQSPLRNGIQAQIDLNGPEMHCKKPRSQALFGLTLNFDKPVCGHTKWGIAVNADPASLKTEANAVAEPRLDGDIAFIDKHKMRIFVGAPS